MIDGFTSADFEHTLDLLRSGDESVRAATASNNHNIILAALDLAAHAFDENQINASETPNALDLAAALENIGQDRLSVAELRYLTGAAAMLRRCVDAAIESAIRARGSIPADAVKRVAALETQLAARAKAMLRLRDPLINILDELDDEGDRVFFGSTNDADAFREAVQTLDGWAWHDVMKEAEGRDFYEELRAANARMAELEATLQASTSARDRCIAELVRVINTAVATLETSGNGFSAQNARSGRDAAIALLAPFEGPHEAVASSDCGEAA